MPRRAARAVGLAAQGARRYPPRTGYSRPLVYQEEPERRLQAFLARTFELEAGDAVLDVGCGFVLPVDIPRHVRLVGLDSDRSALAKNANIDEAIAADIADAELPDEGFAEVLCWNVLEHLASPKAALDTMARALRPGGALVVGMPRRSSLKALITRLTPHRFHVWTYRKLLGFAEAGTPGFGPYRTYFGRDLEPDRFTALAAALQIQKVYEDAYVRIPRLPRVLKAVWRAVGVLGRLATLGRWDPLASELILVFRKEPTPGRL